METPKKTSDRRSGRQNRRSKPPGTGTYLLDNPLTDYGLVNGNYRWQASFRDKDRDKDKDKDKDNDKDKDRDRVRDRDKVCLLYTSDAADE